MEGQGCSSKQKDTDMLTIASLILALAGANDSTFADRAEGVSPTVFVQDTTFSKPTERTGNLVAPSTDTPDLAWGSTIQATRPSDILMESPYFQAQVGF